LDNDTIIVHLQEISRVAEQRRQLIKRIEPLAEENEKLKEAMNLSERNIQRARCKRDLAESNAWDLEYQNGFLTRKLVASSEQVRSQSEQLERESEQLKSVSEQKVGSIYRRLYFHIAVQPYFW